MRAILRETSHNSRKRIASVFASVRCFPRAVLAAALPVIVCLAISGCGMLPVEEEALAPPVLKTYESVEYGLYTVRRGDLVHSKTINVNSVATYNEELFFAVGGVVIAEILVENGDVVHAGDVVVKLESASLEAELQSTKEALTRAITERSNAAQMYDWELYEAKLRGNQDEVAARYWTTKNRLDGEVRKFEIARDDLESKLARRVLCAGIDGVVTNLRNLREGAEASTTEAAMTIVDASRAMFVVTGANAQYFRAGDTATVETAAANYAVTVADAAELGLPNAKENTVYLAAANGEMVSEGLSGSVCLMLEKKKDVLIVPKSAVRTVGEDSYVFLLEDGLRITREVEIGMRTETETEIIFGLEEGEEIISGGI